MRATRRGPGARVRSSSDRHQLCALGQSYLRPESVNLDISANTSVQTPRLSLGLSERPARHSPSRDGGQPITGRPPAVTFPQPLAPLPEFSSFSEDPRARVRAGHRGHRHGPGGTRCPRSSVCQARGSVSGLLTKENALVSPPAAGSSGDAQLPNPYRTTAGSSGLGRFQFATPGTLQMRVKAGRGSHFPRERGASGKAQWGGRLGPRCGQSSGPSPPPAALLLGGID